MKKWIILISFLIFIRTFFFQIYKVSTTSMFPVLMPGDKIFVNRLTYGIRIPFINLRLPGFKKPKRGEVIVFIPPDETKKAWYKWRKLYVKRLIGTGQKCVALRNGNVYINEKETVDPLVARNYYYNQGGYAKEGETVVVPQGKYFFLGDQSISSIDSRFWGFVDKKDIIGKAVFIWWPPKRIGMIE